MARIVLTAVVIALLNVLVGCQSVDSGRGQRLPSRTRTSLGPTGVVNIDKAGETDFVEQIAVNRQAYRQGLKLLIGYYTKIGNNMKFNWAKDELAALDSIPQYKYIVEAEAAGANLRASSSIPEADDLYEDALQLEKEANVLLIASGILIRFIPQGSGRHVFWTNCTVTQRHWRSIGKPSKRKVSV
jgi:hypothetical protein